MGFFWVPFFVIFLALLFFVPFPAKVSFEKEWGEKKISYQIWLWPGLKKRGELSLLLLTEGPRRRKASLFKLWEENKKFLSRAFRFKEIKWHTRVGLGEPALTGLGVGFLWQLKFYFGRWLQKNFTGVPFPFDLRIEPDFSQAGLSFCFCGIFSFFLGHIIIAGLKFWAGFVWAKLFWVRERNNFGNPSFRKFN